MLFRSVGRNMLRPTMLGYVALNVAIVWPGLNTQMFLQRLSHESIKAYATMPIGVMGSKSLRFKVIQQQGTRKNEYVFVLFPSTTLKHLEVHSSNRKNHHYP